MINNNIKNISSVRIVFRGEKDMFYAGVICVRQLLMYSAIEERSLF